ncbi:MAG: hypothetical protein P0116_12630 [Candidatus Nitrosocosmicus sp.]|nr:hypothetical protein [Candidatus Nitrosocosmicus sp.]
MGLIPISKYIRLKLLHNVEIYSANDVHAICNVSCILSLIVAPCQCKSRTTYLVKLSQSLAGDSDSIGGEKKR